MTFFPVLLLAGAAAVHPAPGTAADRAAIIAACYDNIDGQLEGDADRVARTLHPDLVARAVGSGKGHKPLELEVETITQLLDATRKGELKLPRAKWSRSCRILDLSGNVAVVRLQTPWFVSFDQMGNFDGRWLIVNSLWAYSPKR